MATFNNKINLIYIKNINLKLIHSSCVVNSDRNTNVQVFINEQLAGALGNERLSSLQLVKYESSPSAPMAHSESSDVSLPWLFEVDGKTINYNDQIKLFDGIKMASQFLEARYGLNSELVSEVKIAEIIKPFKEDKDITVLDFYNHISRLYNENKDVFVKDLTSVPITSTAGSGVKWTDGIEPNSFKPLGQLGEITLNEAIVKAYNLKWDMVLNTTEVTVHAAPVAVNLISYSVMLKGYMKYVYNRPLPSNLTNEQTLRELKLKNKNLAIFSLMAAPLFMVLLRMSSPGLKDMFDVNLSTGVEVDLNNNTNGFYLFLSQLHSKIPSWVKLAFKLLILVLLILKLIGITVFDLFNNLYYLKIYSITSCSLVIGYQLLNLYLIHKFSVKKIKYSEVLPDFIIKWLQDLEVLSSSKPGINSVKQMCYTQIFIYLFLLVCTGILL